jgi:hypothetical protein
MKLTIAVPESATVTPADFLDQAARGYGWDASQGVTATEFVEDALLAELHARYRSARSTAARAEADAEVPVPESRALRVAREREEARVAEEERVRGEAEAAGGADGGARP